MCAAALAPTAAAVQPPLAVAAVAATAYPCIVGDAACYCKWRGALGYFADNDPTVVCK